MRDNIWFAYGQGGDTAVMKQVFTVTKGGRRHTFLETVLRCTMVTNATYDFAMSEVDDLLRRTSLARSKVVTVSSLGGSRAIPRYGLIGSTKGALESLTRHLALEMGPDGVNVNCVCAGVVDTGALSALPERQAVLESRRQRSLVGGVNPTPEDVAGVILFMASPLADRIQGQTIVVDGGGAIQV